jgi:hypothetical protein
MGHHAHSSVLYAGLIMGVGTSPDSARIFNRTSKLYSVIHGGGKRYGDGAYAGQGAFAPAHVERHTCSPYIGLNYTFGEGSGDRSWAVVTALCSRSFRHPTRVGDRSLWIYHQLHPVTLIPTAGECFGMYVVHFSCRDGSSGECAAGNPQHSGASLNGRWDEGSCRAGELPMV